MSDKEKLKQAISETLNKDKPQDSKQEAVNEITDDIWKALMTEMKVELDLLLIKDPRDLFRQEEPGSPN